MFLKTRIFFFSDSSSNGLMTSTSGLIRLRILMAVVQKRVWNQQKEQSFPPFEGDELCSFDDGASAADS